MPLGRFLGRPRRLIAVAFAAGFLSACATPPEDAELRAEFEKQNDPIERLNRGVFEVNYALDALLLKPAAQSYRDLVPDYGRDSVRSFLNNLGTPVVLANDVLQGEAERARITVARFLVNTTIGLGGLFDVATDLGLVYHGEDFGQTLAVWGTEEGFYLMLPLFGPSNPRDGIGLVVDFLIDPFNWYARGYDRAYLTYGRAGTHAVDHRARNIDILDELEETSIDYYSAIRSLYRQRRADEIANGRPSANVPAPGISGPAAKAPGGDKVSEAE